MIPVRRRTTELGTERYCRRCHEWWPEDDEFWNGVGGRYVKCRACARWFARRHHARKSAA